jgi:predicted lactoylglutathione lyase
MEPRLSLITLGVADVRRSRTFYEDLGWHGQEAEETVFFQTGGAVIVLWGRDKLAADSGVPDSGRGTFDGVVLAHNVRRKEEVAQVIAAAQGAGATVTREPGDTFYGGYAGCFADPDGHVWEIAYNPGFTIEADGSITLPDFGGQ